MKMINGIYYILFCLCVCLGSYVAYKLRITDGEYEPFDWIQGGSFNE